MRNALPHPRLVSTLAVSLALVFPATSLAAAVDYFLKIDGIEGESTDDRHKNEIDVESWSLGVAVKTATATGGGGGAGAPCLSPIAVVKKVDKASPLLFQAAAVGKHIKEATLTARKAGKDQQEYYVVKFQDLLVSSVQTGGATGSDLPTESISLNYASMTVTYKPQKADGSLGDPVVATIASASRC